MRGNPERRTLPPGSTFGVLGGGQLGRMFTQAAQSLGYKVCVLDPDGDSPAGAVADEHLRSGYMEDTALATIAKRCQAVTTEFENVPAGVLMHLSEFCAVAPGGHAVAIAQDRALEKRFFSNQGVPVAPHAVIGRIDDFRLAPSTIYPAILKTAKLGYDGKGQVPVDSDAQAREAWVRLGRVACVLEKKLGLRQEISCIVCRAADGSTVTFPPSENEHRSGILAAGIVPARITAEVEDRARRYATLLAQALDYVGVLCIEFFVLDDGHLVANEMAPRPHNSGHYTIDACHTSQFEQQARILAGLPLGDTSAHSASVMLNLLGDLWFHQGERREPPWAEVLRDPRARLHLYGKKEPRPGRKMGHLTLVAPTRDEALAQAVRAAQVLGLAPPK
jgi:5-(carboxyamino)imidazole ribonucleotide synthase